MDGPGVRKSTLDGIELLDWFDEGVAALVAELERHDPDDSCPNFNPGSANVVGFWLRRQLHETSVHRWDVEAAASGDPGSIEAEVAVDGIDEYLDVFVRTRGKQTLTGSLRLVVSDGGRSWLLAPAARPGRVSVIADGHEPAEAEITASAEELLLHVWRRRAFDEARVHVGGDARVARSLTEPT